MQALNQEHDLTGPPFSDSFPFARDTAGADGLTGQARDGGNRSMWIPKASEILRLYAYLRPAPGTIPEMRLDLFGLRPHRCNQLEIVRGGSHFRTPEPRKSTTD